MISDFQKLSPEIQEKIIEIQKLLNQQITEDSFKETKVVFSSDGETDNRKVSFKLVESENGGKYYEFDYLAW